MVLNIENITDYKTTWNPDEIRIKCVFCGEQKYKLYINLKYKVYHCFRCGTSGKLNSTFKYKKQQEKIITNVNYPDINNMPKDILNYLIKRGLTLKIIKEKNIYYNKENKSIIFPFKNEYGKYIGYIERKLNGKIKYVKPKGWVPSSLYNIEEAIKYDWVIITEGVFDVLRHYKNYPIVALFGKFINKLQLEILKKYFKHIIIALDPDVEIKHIMNMTNKLKRFFTIDVLVTPKDLGDIPNLDKYMIYKSIKEVKV